MALEFLIFSNPLILHCPKEIYKIQKKSTKSSIQKKLLVFANCLGRVLDDIFLLAIEYHKAKQIQFFKNLEK